MARKAVLESHGMTAVEMWKGGWNSAKDLMDEEFREDVGERAKMRRIRTRDDLKGGRTEVFQTSVNALDEYALGYHRYRNVQVECMELIRVIGLAECCVDHNQSCKKPVLPDNSSGKMLLHSNNITGPWTTLELRRALEMSNTITRRHSDAWYQGCKGLMKDYVQRCGRVKMCNCTPLKSGQCEQIHKYHEMIGLSNLEDIKPE